jgi:hypothetical protein
MSWHPGRDLDSLVERTVFGRATGDKVPPYSSDEQTALAVVVEMERQGWRYSEDLGHDMSGRPGWRCKFDRRSDDPMTRDVGEFSSHSRALAICVAALKAVRAA